MDYIDTFKMGKSMYIYCAEREPLIEICDKFNLSYDKIRYIDRYKKYKIQSESKILIQKIEEMLKAKQKQKQV